MAGPSLIVFADYACPWCCLGEAALARLRRDGVAIRSAAFELRPAGTRLPASPEPRLKAAWSRTVEPLAAELGVDMRLPGITVRTRKAHEAAAYARSEGRHADMHEALYRAYWADGRDIGRIDVLVDIGASVGLQRGGLRVALDIDRWTAAVEQEQAWARQLGVQAVPAYLLQQGAAEGLPARELRVGLQRYDELRIWMRHDV